MSSNIAILDFGSGRISVLTGSRGPNDTVQVTSQSEVKYAGFSNGEWLRPELLTNAIHQAILGAENTSGIKIRHLYIGVPGEFSSVVTKNITHSYQKRKRLTESDVENLMIKGQDFLSSDVVLINRQPIFYTLDNGQRLIEPVGQSSSTLTGLISYIMAESNFTSFIDSIMESLGIESAEYVSAALAQSLYLLESHKRDRISVLIDVGYITTTVAVVRGDGLLALSSFSLGGGYIAGDLREYFAMPFADAEILKRQVSVSIVPESDHVYEVNGKEYSASIVNRIVLERLKVITKAVQKCISLCKFDIPVSAGFYLTGGGISYMRGAKELMGQFLERDIELIKLPLPSVDKYHNSSSIGLLNMIIDASSTVVKRRGILGFFLGE